jgi:DNA helicase-2/ATP-dependent DNA helicase PcrA
LAYVGLTRARRRAIVSWAANRRIYANWQSSIPSRFVSELPDEHVSRAAAPGLQAARTAEPASSLFPAIGFGGARRGRVIEAGAWEVQQRPERGDRIPLGARVFHQKFGYGTVKGVDDDKLDVEFSTGMKRILDRFVERA